MRRRIPDPEATKPEDWDERATIPDETDVKPDGYDDIPAKIVDAEATKPDDWDEEDDGAWEAPLIPNPAYKGKWEQKTIPNPAYKGKWEAPLIANPAFKDEPNLYAFKDLAAVGIELWQVKAGTLFDNMIVTDDIASAMALAESTWKASKDLEKAAFDEHKKAEEAEAEARAKAAADKAKDEEELGDDEEDDDDEEEDAANLHDEL